MSESQGAIQKLIERTTRPTILPELQLRFVPPGEDVSALRNQLETTDAELPKNSVPSTSKPAPAPASAPAPHVDINLIADKVYQTLLRRQQLERERTGLY